MRMGMTTMALGSAQGVGGYSAEAAAYFSRVATDGGQ